MCDIMIKTNILSPNTPSVIHAYAEAGLPNQAENVMRLMFSDFKSGNTLAEPNVRCLTSTIT
jgi:pentatricopeptide repeat protein